MSDVTTLLNNFITFDDGSVRRKLTKKQQARVDALEAKRAELSRQVTELQEQLDSVENEIDRLTWDRSNSIMGRLMKPITLPIASGTKIDMPRFAPVTVRGFQG